MNITIEEKKQKAIDRAGSDWLCPDRAGRGGCTAAHNLGIAAQRVYAGHQPAEYDRPAGRKQIIRNRGRETASCIPAPLQSVVVRGH